MKTKTSKGILAWALAGVVGLTGLTATAAEPKEAKEVKLPRSHVEAVNFTNMTFTVAAKDTNIVLQITAETRFFLNDKPAISKDLEAADHVRGTMRPTADNKPVAVRIHIEKLAPK